MPADVTDYRVIGDDMQAVIVTLDPGETVVAEAGAMMFMEFGIELQSLPFSRLADRIIAAAPRAGGGRRAEGGVLGTLAGLLDGDNS